MDNGLVYWLGFDILRWTAFFGAMAVSLRRPLRLARSDIFLVFLCVAAGAGLAKYLVDGMTIPRSGYIAAMEWTGLVNLDGMPTDPNAAGTERRTVWDERPWFQYIVGNRPPDADSLWFSRVLDGHPVCFLNKIGETANYINVCEDMSLVIKQTLMAMIGLLAACLVPRWRISPLRVLLVGLVVLVFAVVMVNALAGFEAYITRELTTGPEKGNYRLLVDAAFPEAFLYGFMALMLARIGLRKRSRASHELSTPEPAAS